MCVSYPFSPVVTEHQPFALQFDSAADHRVIDTPRGLWLSSFAFRTHPGPRKGLSLPVKFRCNHNLDAASGPPANAERLDVKVASSAAES